MKKNRERYEAGGRSVLKEEVARQWREEYDFATTGDPEMDMIIAMGLRDMKEDTESEASVSSNLGGSVGEVKANKSKLDGSAGEGGETKSKSKRQLKRERQRENARRHNMQRGLK